MEIQTPNFTPRLQQALQHAREAAENCGTSIIDIDHLALGLVSLRSGPVRHVLLSLGVNMDDLFIFLQDVLLLKNVVVPHSAESKISYSNQVKKIFAIAIIFSQRMEHEYVGLLHFTLALCKNEDGAFCDYLKNTDIPLPTLTQKIKSFFLQEQTDDILNEEPDVLGYNQYNRSMGPSPQGAPAGPPPRPGALSQYAINFNELVISSQVDKVIGRESEIKCIAEILCRKNKNNPLILGDAGVGKTAIIEGLATQIVEGRCTDFLLNKTVYGLDLASMIAGTKYRGQFEERLKKLVKEVEADENAILFIDELHTLVGAGSAEGSMDAANILKPKLARGALKCIGATTQKEYNKSIAKDGALDRRFQVVSLQEPTKEETQKILEGIIGNYENFHNVIYRKSLLPLACNLAERYLPDRNFPDKAIDLIDHAGARAKIRAFARPAEALEMEKEIEDLFTEEEKTKSKKQKQTLQASQKALLDKYENILSKWDPLNKKAHVRQEDLLHILSFKTGINIKDLNCNPSQDILSLNKRLEKIVIGQPHAINKIHQTLLRNKSGLGNKNKPLGSFLFLGSSGVGKTYLTKILAQEVFGSSNKLIHLDMSEFGEKQAASKLIGAAPGYVGYEEGGMLTEKIRRNPYSVVLFDELEKAGEEVTQLLLQILDEGRLTDTFGRSADFRNALIILTGNLGSRHLSKNTSVGFQGAENTTSTDKVLSEAKNFFRPEFLNRLDNLIVFNNFTEEDIKQIAEIELKKVEAKLGEKNIKSSFTPNVVRYIVKKTLKENLGARPIQRLIEDEIESLLAVKLISRHLKPNSEVTMTVEEDKIVLKES